MNKVIRAKNGRIIGRMKYLQNKIEARTPSGVLVGWYDIKADLTRFANGKINSLGNTISMLL